MYEKQKKQYQNKLMLNKSTDNSKGGRGIVTLA